MGAEPPKKCAKWGPNVIQDCAGSHSFWPAPSLEANRPIAYFTVFFTVSWRLVESSDKRDMHGLLYRIFAALKFDGAKLRESPTLTMPQESLFLDTETEEQAGSKS